MVKPELAGVSVVGAGAFNPAIIHPKWLAEKGLLDPSAADGAVRPDAGSPFLVSPQMAAFRAGWLWVQVTQQQAVFSTVYEGRESDLRDLAKGVFDLLPETPVHGLGINADIHVRLPSAVHQCLMCQPWVREACPRNYPLQAEPEDTPTGLLGWAASVLEAKFVGKSGGRCRGSRRRS